MAAKPNVSKTSGMMIRPSVAKRIRKSLPYYLMILLPMVYLLLFKYYPMLGVQIAFREYKVRGGNRTAHGSD